MAPRVRAVLVRGRSAVGGSAQTRGARSGACVGGWLGSGLGLGLANPKPDPNPDPDPNPNPNPNPNPSPNQAPRTARTLRRSTAAASAFVRRRRSTRRYLALSSTGSSRLAISPHISLYLPHSPLLAHPARPLRLRLWWLGGRARRPPLAGPARPASRDRDGLSHKYP